MNLGTMRHRIQDQQSPTIFQYYGSQEPLGGGTPVPFAYLNSAHGLSGVRTDMYDEPHPGYRTLMSQGRVILGELSLTRSDRAVSMTTFTLGPLPEQQNYVITYNMDRATRLEAAVPFPSFDLTSDLSRMGEVVLAQAYAKVNQSALCTGETLKDLDSTVRMLRHPFKGSLDLVKKIGKYREKYLKKSGSNAAKAGANAWLEYRYGWKPLLLDMDQIVEYSHRKRDMGQGTRRVARAGDRLERKASESFVHASYPTTGAGWYYTGGTQKNQELRVNAGVIFRVQNRTTSEGLAKLLGIRPRDVLPTLWEMTPYSFVVDWFVNVGSWLQAVMPDPRIISEGAWVTSVNNTELILNDGTVEIDVYFGPTQGTIPVPRTYGGSTRKTVVVTRSVNPSITPTPVLTGKMLSGLHSIDAMSLSCSSIIKQLGFLKH